MYQKVKRLNEKYHQIPIFIIALIVLSYIDLQDGYFKNDIDLFQIGIKQYNKHFLLLFVILFLGKILFEKPLEVKMKFSKIKKDFAINLFYLMFFGLSIFFTIDNLITDLALLINKINVKGEVHRSYEIAYYNYEESELVFFDNGFEKIKLNNDNYLSLRDTTKFHLKFNIGLLNIPFNPQFIDSKEE
jgi:hypothetical protein